VFPGALGDFLLALPAFRLLRARRPAGRWTFVVGEGLRALPMLAGVADETASVDGPELARVLAGGDVPSWLGADVELHAWLGTRDPDVRHRLATCVRSAHFFRVQRGPGDVHAAVGYGRALGVAVDGDALAAAARIAPPPSARTDRLSEDLGDHLLALHPGAGARAKRWDARGFDAVAGWWRTRGGSVVVLLGPAEPDVRPPAGSEVVRDWPLADLAAVLGRAVLYVGNDSGVSHLASAVGTPGVVLFGPTDPARWRPPGMLVAVSDGPPAPDGIALDTLPVERVLAACRQAYPDRAGSSLRPRPAGTSP